MLRKQNENEKEKKEGIFQKIKDIDKNDFILIIATVVIVPIICFSLFLMMKNKKTVDKTVVQSQVVIQQNINKTEKVYLNETSKLNSNNFEIFISKKYENKGIILIKASDFIKNNSNILLYKAVKNVKISGNPEIIEKLNFNITNNSNVNLKKNTIQIELDNNIDNNSVLSLQINHEVLTKDELVNDETLLTIEYVESYAD